MNYKLKTNWGKIKVKLLCFPFLYIFILYIYIYILLQINAGIYFYFELLTAGITFLTLYILGSGLKLILKS